MIKFLALAVVAIMGVAAQAEVITCIFSEPWLTAKVETKTGAVKFLGTGSKKPVRATVTDFSRNPEAVEAKFVVAGVSYDLHIALNKAGNDGGSERIFPMAGTFINYEYNEETKTYRDITGGCFTKKKKPVCPSTEPCT